MEWAIPAGVLRATDFVTVLRPGAERGPSSRRTAKLAVIVSAFPIRVECYAGYKADEKPQRFWLQDRCYEVLEVLDRWYSPGVTWFRVRAGDGDFYVLRHTESGQEDSWTLESFRQGCTV